MSNVNYTHHHAENGKMNLEEYGKALATIKQKEGESVAALERQEEELIQEIAHVEEDEYKREEWLKDHQIKWYNPLTWNYGPLRAMYKKQLSEDETHEKALKSALSKVMKTLDAIFDAEFSGPLHLLDLQVNKLFKELNNNGGKISQKLLEDVMAALSQVMALVQMILAQTDDQKGHQESLIGQITSLHYQEETENTETDIKDYTDMMHQSAVMKIVSTVIKAVLCVAAIALAAATGGACSVLTAIIIAVVVMSGASDKLTTLIANKLKEDGVSDTTSKILADVIVTAVMVVATLGVGAVSALAEGALTDAISSTMSTTLKQVTEDAINEAVEKAMATVSQDSSEAAMGAASTAAKTVASEVATTAGRSAMKDAVRTVLRQALASTIKQSATTAGRETLSQSIKSTIQEVMQSAMADAQQEINSAASQAAESAEQEVIETMTQQAAKSAASGQDGSSATSRSLSSLKVGRSLVNGLGVGVIGTNLVGDSLGGLLQLILGKDVKKKEWYKIVMDIVQVIQTILALVMMGKYGGDMFDNGDLESASGRGSKQIQKIMSMTILTGGIAEGTCSIAEGIISETKSTVTQSLACNKQALVILNHLVQEMNQMIKDEQKHEAEELKGETQSTITTINALNQGLEGYAQVLAASAV